LLENLLLYILRTEPQGKKLLCSAHKMKKETSENLEVFFVSMHENVRVQANTIFTIDSLGHNEN